MKSYDPGGTDDRPSAADDADDDVRLRRLFAALGQRSDPSQEQLARWRRSFEDGLDMAPPRRRYLAQTAWLSGALAATVVLILMVRPGSSPEPGAPPLARVVTAFGGVVVRREDAPMRSLAADDQVLAGDRLETGQRSGASLSYRQADVRIDAQSTLEVHDDRLVLRRGGVYVDTGKAPQTATPGAARRRLRIETRAGFIDDFGTQFVVRVSDDAVVAAVREGGIELHRRRAADGAAPLRLTAGPDRARMLVVAAGGDVRSDDVDAHGTLWAWVLASSAGILPEGRSADELLRWAAREQGRRLEYRTDEARQVARRATLGGSREPLGPVAAVATVDAATRLDIEQSDPAMLRVFVKDDAGMRAPPAALERDQQPR